jgi:hypothetical protein
MNHKCKRCGLEMIALTAVCVGFLICSRCGFKERVCNMPDLSSYSSHFNQQSTIATSVSSGASLSATTTSTSADNRYYRILDRSQWGGEA